MLERCEEKSAELLMDELLEKGITVDGRLLWRAGGGQFDVRSETSWPGFEYQLDHGERRSERRRLAPANPKIGRNHCYSIGYRIRVPDSQEEEVMPELIQEFKNEVLSRNGVRYVVLVYGERRPDGNWEGWLEFRPEKGASSLRTGRETTQPDRNALVYWASGLEPIYFEGALDRALRAEGRGV